MKAYKKHLGTKIQIRAKKERKRLITTAIFLGFILLMIALSAYFAYTILNQSPEQNLIEPSLQFKPENSNSQLKAAIVDQLSLTLPNQTFIETAATTLTKAGYTVDYFSGEKVTVGFWRNLPTYGYKIVILRVHSSATESQGTEWPVTFFTSERYDKTKYVSEQLNGQVGGVAYSKEEVERGIMYFGIGPAFVTQSMKGRFQNTVIIMMGCQGLENTLMAKAFVEKGAKVYIGWSQGVTASHTDTATTRLLQHFITEKQTLKQSIQETFKEVGLDPVYNSLLIYYPLEAGEQTTD